VKKEGNEDYTSRRPSEKVSEKERNGAYVSEGRVRIETQSSSPNRQPEQRRKEMELRKKARKGGKKKTV
jgi:hypothetical protein